MKKIALNAGLIFCMTGFSLLASAKNPTPSTPTISQPAQQMAIEPTTTVTQVASPTDFEDVKLNEKTTLNIKGNKTDLMPVSYGIRKKKVFGLATVKVYVLEFLSAQAGNLNRHEEKILSSLKTAGPIQLKLTLSRDLAGKKISDSFREALEHNGVDIKNPSKELNEVLTLVEGIKEFTKGETFSLIFSWKDSTATLYAQLPDQTIKTVSGPEQFASDLLSIWFGKPVDDKLADLKKSLLK